MRELRFKWTTPDGASFDLSLFSESEALNSKDAELMGKCIRMLLLTLKGLSDGSKDTDFERMMRELMERDDD